MAVLDKDEVFFMQWLHNGKDFFLDLMFPHACVNCRKLGEILCVSCKIKVERIPPSCFVCKKLVPWKKGVAPGRTCVECRKKSFISAFFSPFSYDFPTIREMIHALKFQRTTQAGDLLGVLLADTSIYFEASFPENGIVVPMPLHKKRKRTRGFNQSEVLAKSFLKQLSSPLLLETNVLMRSKNTQPQTLLSGEERKKNVHDAFFVSDQEKISGKTVILFDDVKTTGSTMESAARALKVAGAKEIWAITVAH